MVGGDCTYESKHDGNLIEWQKIRMKLIVVSFKICRFGVDK